jgi:hypothetical protein
MGLTVALWCYYLVASIVVILFSGKGFYDLFFMERSERCFFQLFWMFWFLWLWEFSVKLYPDLWDNPECTLSRKTAFSSIVFIAHPVSVAAYFLTNPLIYQLPAHFKLFDLLIYLRNPSVLIILAIIFVASLKLRRFGLAAGLWGFVGYYHLLQLLPEKSGMAAKDMRMLFTMMASMNGLIFMGGNLVIMLGVAYILFHRE